LTRCALGHAPQLFRFRAPGHARARRMAMELVDVAKQLLDQLGGPIDAPRDAAGQPGGEAGGKPDDATRYPVGATRFRGGEYVDPRVVEGLELILDSLLKREAAR